MAPKRVAVIGAGIVGIFAIKQVAEEGLQPVCFERTDQYGGTWYYRDEAISGQASIMPTTIINHSKEMGAFSDFPPRKEFSNFMKHSEMYKYITEYVKKHNLEQYIQFQTEAIRVEKAEDYIRNGKWNVSVKNLHTGEILTETYDGVIVATGHISEPSMPHLSEQEKFRGKIMHTHELKEVDEFKGQNVVIVGMGCSGLDAAVEISAVAKQVYLSTRCGAVVLNRVGPNGYPIDYTLFRRYLIFLMDIVPTDLASWYVETFYLDQYFDHNLHYIKPKYHLLSKDPNVNDHIGYKFLNGSVIQKASIKYFTESGVVFDGEEDTTDVDTVVMATGYTWGYPFLEDGVLEKDNEIINLYKCMYPPQLPHPTLAFVGLFLPFGALFPLAELQCRWAAYLLAGYGKLPSKNDMIRDVMKRHSANKKRYIPGEKMTVRVDYVQYMDEIAKEIGVKPNLLKYLFKDFQLFIKLMFGPCLPYQFRLEGHRKWEGARDAIMTSKERVEWPLCKRKQPSENHGVTQHLIDYIAQLLYFIFTLPKYLKY